MSITTEGLTLNQLAERNAEYITTIEQLEQKLIESERYGRQTDITIDNLEMQLNAEREAKMALAAENAALKQFPDKIVGFIGKLGSSEIGSDTKEKIKAAAKKIKTPATDSFLAEVRAQGVEKFASVLELRGRHQDYVEIANAYAAQLRKGVQS